MWGLYKDLLGTLVLLFPWQLNSGFLPSTRDAGQSDGICTYEFLSLQVWWVSEITAKALPSASEDNPTSPSPAKPAIWTLSPAVSILVTDSWAQCAHHLYIHSSRVAVNICNCACLSSVRLSCQDLIWRYADKAFRILFCFSDAKVPVVFESCCPLFEVLLCIPLSWMIWREGKEGSKFLVFPIA